MYLDNRSSIIHIVNAPIALKSPRIKSSNAILFVVCLAQFMVILDVAIVNVALPSMRDGLHFSTSGLQWVVNAYTLTFAGFLMLGARSADLLGRRRVFLFGTGLFALSSLICALASSRGLLIGVRALQGFAGAIVSPATLSIITSSFAEGTERNRGVAAWGAIGGLGASSGALLGGFLTQAFGWPAIFAVNVPLGAIVIALGLRVIPAGARHTGPRNFDATGAVLVTAGLVALTYGIVRTDTLGWGAPGVLVPIAVGGRPACRIRGLREPIREGPAGPAVDLPAAAAARRQRGRRPALRRPVPVVVLPHPLHAAGAALRRDRGGTRLPADHAHDLRHLDPRAATR